MSLFVVYEQRGRGSTSACVHCCLLQCLSDTWLHVFSHLQVQINGLYRANNIHLYSPLKSKKTLINILNTERQEVMQLKGNMATDNDICLWRITMSGNGGRIVYTIHSAAVHNSYL